MKSVSALPLPPREYDVEYMQRLIRQLQIVINSLNNSGPITAGSDLSQTDMAHPISALTLINIPTSATGLPSGSVWSDGGTLKIVS